MTNNIDVDYKLERSDAEIREDVRKALHWDAYVDDALLTVKVNDGKVTLNGTVGSLAEKRRARTLSWVAGVQLVDNDKVDVKWWARNDKLRKDKYVDKSDETVEQAVKDALLYDPRVASFKFDVDADNGYVTLRGAVNSEKARRVAASDARSVVGVWAVDNNVKVRPAELSDAKIERNVESALVSDPYVDRYDITVSVVDGEVNLYGGVDSVFEKAEADDVASRQVGVMDVNNFLSVNTRYGDMYDPYTDEWYLYDYDWYAAPDVTVPDTDWQIAEQIRSQYFWSPFVDGGDITVQVDDGVADLTGNVDTWRERQAATENALEGGAVVDNNLRVKYGPDYYQP